MSLSCKPEQEPPFPAVSGELNVPVFILEEHHNLIEQFDKLKADTSGLSEAVLIKLKALLQHHFTKEEQTVLPFLQLLNDTAAFRRLHIEGENKKDLPDRLREEIKHLGVEHQLINAYLKELQTGSNQFRQAEIISLENAIKKHAMVEDQIYFPAAVMAVEN
jgi:hemerythrin-like domain-containing protein